MKLPRLPLAPRFAASALVMMAGASHANAESIYGLTLGDRLVTFDSAAPGAIVGSVSITGLGAGDSVVGIDFRPATGQLYGLGRSSMLYVIDPATGAATQVGAGPLTPSLSGDAFGVDFNPTVDRLRIVSDNGQNLRVNPNTGAVAATDASLRYADADPNLNQFSQIVGAAYTDNTAGATTTTLYGIDSVLDLLVRQAPPNDGILNTIGSLGVNASDLTGFDISGISGTAFASLTEPGDTLSGFYTINLGTGAATLVGDVASGEILKDIAAVPEPSTVALLGVGLAGLVGMGWRRRKG